MRKLCVLSIIKLCNSVYSVLVFLVFVFVCMQVSEVDISIPIPSPRGIISCTLKDAQSMTVRDLEHEIAALGPQQFDGRCNRSRNQM